MAFAIAIVVFIALRLPGSEKGFSLLWGIPLVIQLGIALLLLQLVHVFSIMRQRSLLPAFFYLLLTGTNSLFFYDLIGSIASLLITFCFFFLFDSYNNPRSQQNAFNISVLLAAGSLYWPPMLLFLPFFWIGLLQLRSFNGRTFFAGVLGFVMIALFLFTWSVYKGDWTIFLDYLNRYKVLGDVQQWDIRSVLQVSSKEWIREGFVVVLFFLSIWRILISGISEKVRTRTFLNYLYIFPLFVLALVFFQSEGKQEWILISYVPISLLIAHFFTFTIKEWSSWLLLIAILFFLIMFV